MFLRTCVSTITTVSILAPVMEAAVALTAFAVAWLPGAALTRLLQMPGRDPLERIAREIALGLSFWPLLFLYTSTAGLRWTAVGARVVLCAAAAVLLPSLLRLRFRRPDRVTVAGLALVLVTGVTRWFHVRDVVWPVWVDSVHHTMIVRLLVERGTIPSSYEPFIADSTFYYHWGFHACIAFVSWISGVTSPLDLPRLLLIAGQVLNTLVFLSVYAAARALWSSRVTALLAAVLATLVSFFPAYYVSWGRYTQLCALIVLPPLAVLFWRVGRHPRWRAAVALAVMAAGLLLIHVRVAIVFAVLALVLAVLLARQTRWKGLGTCALAGMLAIALVAPWLLHLRSVPQVGAILSPQERLERWETPNDAPADLVWAPGNRALYVAATGGLFALLPVGELGTAWRIAGVVLWIALIVTLLRARRRRARLARRLTVVIAWVALTALLINSASLGLPRVRIVPNSAAVIMLFLPLSLMAAGILRVLVPRARSAMVLLCIVAVTGAFTMRRIVNPSTVLFTAADEQAMRWIARNVSPGAIFAVGVRPWIGDSYVGIDGGYWIPVATGRTSLLPPGLYPWVVSDEDADAIAKRLRQLERMQSSGTLDLPAEVTHLYFGAKNRTPLRDAALRSPHLTTIYDADGVTIVSRR